MTKASEERVAAVASSLMDKVRETIVEHRVTYDEYAAAKKYGIALGQAGEWPVFCDVFFEATVERVDSEGREGSDGAIEGPYSIPGAKELSPPYAMPMRPDEPGDVLSFSGTVRDADGIPISRASVAMWQSDSSGTYSGIPYPDEREPPPPGNLRARSQTDAEGHFEIRTIIPVPYEIPNNGPTGALLAAGWHAFRPAHLHARIPLADQPALLRRGSLPPLRRGQRRQGEPDPKAGPAQRSGRAQGPRPGRRLLHGVLCLPARHGVAARGRQRSEDQRR